VDRWRSDRDRLVQALTNIIGNALTHTPPGGEVSVSGHADGDMCQVQVTDTGIGIPEGQLDAIFERFTRLDPDGTGIGIGLNIARTVVRAHGGDITASSNSTGSTFTIRLPSAVSAGV
jgi:two-component system sensor histidine kinase BaeS